ncbi:MAG: chaperone modulator CbpM [Blastocatellia bacterium]
MNKTGYQIAIYWTGQRGRIEQEQLTLEGLAARTGLHPTLIERFVEYGLIEPAQRAGSQMLFDLDCVVRLRKIERLRRDLGINLPSVAVILDLLDRMNRLEQEVERLRGLAP